MSTAPLPPPKAMPPRNGKPSSNGTSKRFTTSSGIVQKAERIGIYGAGGIGKTELAALIKASGFRPVFLDIEDGSKNLDVDRVDGIESWEDLIAALNESSLWSGAGAIILDSVTQAEILAADFVVRTIPHEKGHPVKRVEDYGFGKGYSFIYETFLSLFSALDSHIRDGRHVILVSHDCTANVPNPMGEDYIRYEPRLQSPPSGKNSIRHRFKEWLDHLFFVGLDLHVNDKTGKAIGGNTRTIYPVEMPTHWAKSRRLSDPIVYDRGNPELWNQLFAGRKS